MDLRAKQLERQISYRMFFVPTRHRMPLRHPAISALVARWLIKGKEAISWILFLITLTPESFEMISQQDGVFCLCVTDSPVALTLLLQERKDLVFSSLYRP